MTLEFSRQISEKNAHVSNLIKTHPVGSELFHVGGQTDMTEAQSLFAILQKRLQIYMNIQRKGIVRPRTGHEGAHGE
jgi:hypothetical protein